MHQTGRGALKPEDIRRLATGVWSFVANSGVENKPLAILIPSRRVANYDDYGVSSRVFFYICSLLMDILPLHEMDFHAFNLYFQFR